MGGGDWVDRVLERIDTALVNVADPLERRRLKVLRLRALGYTFETIAEELNISAMTAHVDMKWCMDHVPAAYENAQAFRYTALAAIDRQIEYLSRPRTVVRRTEAGDTYEETIEPSETTMRVIMQLREQQARLLGANAPVALDATVKVRYEVAGVNTEVLR